MPRRIPLRPLALTMGALLALAVGALVALGDRDPSRTRYREAMRTIDLPPPNSPALCAEPGFAPEGPVLVALGDSLVRGVGGYDLLADVGAHLPPEAVLINAGVNGDRAADVLARLDPVIACGPAAVVILIGTNDAIWGEAGAAAEDAYRTALTAILDRLRSSTSAKLGVLTLPLVGEIPGGALDARAATLSAIADAVAREAGAERLPLRARQEVLLAASRPPTPLPCETPEQVEEAIDDALRRAFSTETPDWDGIAAANGLSLTVDCVHLTAKGAAPAARLIEAFFGSAP